MKREIKVSIVTPSFNQGRFLGQTIESVLYQDYENIEYIVIDGGSTDESKDVLDRYSSRITYWKSEPDQGQSHAIIKGFNRASGEVLAWLNSDDMLETSAVSQAVSCLQENPSVGLVYGDRVYIDEGGNQIGSLRLPKYTNGMFGRDQTIPQESAFFLRSLYEQVGGIDASLNFAMDFDLWCKMSKVAQFKHTHTYSGIFREHAAAKSVVFHDESRGKKFLEEHQRVFKLHFGRLPPGKIAKHYYRVERKIRLILENILGNER